MILLIVLVITEVGVVVVVVVVEVEVEVEVEAEVEVVVVVAVGRYPVLVTSPGSRGWSYTTLCQSPALLRKGEGSDRLPAAVAQPLYELRLKFSALFSFNPVRFTRTG